MFQPKNYLAAPGYITSALASIDATHDLENQDICTAIRNSMGPRPSFFVPEMAFNLFVKPQIKLLEAPSLRCVELVYEELVKICHNCTSAVILLLPYLFTVLICVHFRSCNDLHAQLIEVVSELLRERLGPTSEYTQSLIEIQAAYINTNHPSFISGSEPSNQPSRPSISQQVFYCFQGCSLFPLLMFFKPESPEPINGHKPAPEDEDEALSDDLNSFSSSSRVFCPLHNS
jgi:dynamin 1-like protein